MGGIKMVSFTLQMVVNNPIQCKAVTLSCVPINEVVMVLSLHPELGKYPSAMMRRVSLLVGFCGKIFRD